MTLKLYTGNPPDNDYIRVTGLFTSIKGPPQCQLESRISGNDYRIEYNPESDFIKLKRKDVPEVNYIVLLPRATDATENIFYR